MRKPRKLVPGASYHVTAGANRREFILNSPEMKRLFLKILKRAKNKYAFHIANFCIMGNHIHLMIKPFGKEKLSRIMQWVLATFAINFNKRFGITGHVWYDRFHSKVIESFRQYLKTFRYISDNPVRAEIVKRPVDFEFGGIWAYQKGLYEILQPPDSLLRLLFPETAIQVLQA
jgi:REP element-mobilizing transposase RayT